MSDEERVGAALVPEATAGTMPAQEADIVPQRQQLFLDHADQGLVIAAGKIGTSNRAVEKHIADMRKTRRAIEEDDVSRRMPRTMQHLEAVVTERHRLTLGQETVRHAVADGVGYAETASLVLEIVEQ